MSEISNNKHKGIISLIAGGVVYLIFLIYFYVSFMQDISRITYLSMLLILFLPGLNFLYKEFSLRNRGLLLLIVGAISYIFSVIRMIVADVKLKVNKKIIPSDNNIYTFVYNPSENKFIVR